MRNSREFSQSPHLARLAGTVKFPSPIAVSMVSVLPIARIKKHLSTAGNITGSELSMGQTPRSA
ncbi:MAG TPA: hypothetical protein VEN79_09720 [Terriglobia bacterium]|nr:hypothetical protein [Terriglobia bacterium]